jgi:peptide/nickel transport system substrate-binding protein
LSGCQSPDVNDDGGAKKTEGAGSATGSVSVGWNEPMFSLNQQSSTGHNAVNGNMTYLTRGHWGYYDKDLNFVENKQFGETTKTSDDPLTVTQTINEGAKWSDGVPVSAADQLLEWAARGGLLNNVKDEDVERDEEFNAKVADDQVFFDAGDPAIAIITDTPTIADNGRDVTYVYSKPFSDWKYNFTEVGVPAHIVAKRALGIDDPDEAKAALIKAIQDKDNASLAKISKVWNDDFNVTKMPDGADKELMLSCGAYTFENYEEGQFLTLKANPDYTWGEKPTVNEIVVRFNGDPMAQVQAMNNGELDIIQPQVTTDVKSALADLKDVKTDEASEGTYEHVDMMFNTKGPFDPATYGGDAEKAKKVRQAFLKTIPRQEIVEKLIQPLQSDATVRDSFNVVPGAPTYDATIAANGSSAYGQVDIEGAKALLAEAGVKTPVDVRFLYDKANMRRSQEYQTIFESAKAAGFNVVDLGNEKWSSMMGNGSYDASLFGWQSTSTAVNEPAANYVTGGQNNYAGFSDKKVDDLYSQLQTELDPAAQQKINDEVEKILYDDAFGVPLYQFPGILAWNEAKVTGVSTITLSPTFFWNYWEWQVAGK